MEKRDKRRCSSEWEERGKRERKKVKKIVVEIKINKGAKQNNK